MALFNQFVENLNFSLDVLLKIQQGLVAGYYFAGRIE